MSPLPRHWGDGYVAAFHAEHSGITERVLARSRWQGTDPYRWCSSALGRLGGRTLDLGCGSGPLAQHVSGWIGVDLSAEELAAARALGRSPTLRASIDRLPLPSASVDAVVCSMALQVVDHLDAVLAELSRVLRPRGRVAALLPASGPLGVTDACFYLRLQTTLRQRIQYPNDALLRARNLRALAAEAGLAVTSDERQPFVLPLRSESDADELTASLYLPEIDPGRLAAGRDVMRSRAQGEVTIPLRRVVLDRAVRR